MKLRNNGFEHFILIIFRLAARGSCPHPTVRTESRVSHEFLFLDVKVLMDALIMGVGSLKILQQLSNEHPSLVIPLFLLCLKMIEYPKHW